MSVSDFSPATAAATSFLIVAASAFPSRMRAATGELLGALDCLSGYHSSCRGETTRPCPRRLVRRRAVGGPVSEGDRGGSHGCRGSLSRRDPSPGGPRRFDRAAGAL